MTYTQRIQGLREPRTQTVRRYHCDTVWQNLYSRSLLQAAVLCYIRRYGDDTA
jgi:hypothetical protein